MTALLKEKASHIRMILLDVDGTLTDGQLIFGPEGELYKSFNIKDGMGIHLAQKAGIRVGLISGRWSKIVENRAKELAIDHIWQGVKNKNALLNDILKGFSLRPEHIAFMGDDLNDLPILKAVGLSAAVADAVDEVKAFVDYVAERSGGRGAVRELIDLILGVQQTGNGQ